MFSRYTTAVVVGLVMTAALIWLMQFLIEISEAAVTTTEQRTALTLGRTIVDTRMVIDEPVPDPPMPPVHPPPLVPPTNPDGPNTPVAVRAQSATPVVQQNTSAMLDSGNRALINIISAEPDYPLRASQKNIEGFVVVRFDVTEAGTVENVIVVESSSTLFERAAINAAYRSRYKPQTIEGMPQRVRGLHKRFLFRMGN